MAYHAGTSGLEHIGIASGEPRIICDECRGELMIGPWPPRWFLDGKAKPGWAKARLDSGRSIDICPPCVRRLLADIE